MPAIRARRPARRLTSIKPAPYRHLLVATDGSARARRAAAAAVALAAALGARLSALYVVPEGVPTAFSGAKLYASPALAPQYRRALQAAADQALGVVARAAGAAGVPHSTLRATARAPWQAIVRSAKAHKCDLIVLATRGTKGWHVLGSQTVKAIAHTRIPVLVLR